MQQFDLSFTREKLSCTDGQMYQNIILNFVQYVNWCDKTIDFVFQFPYSNGFGIVV